MHIGFARLRIFPVIHAESYNQVLTELPEPFHFATTALDYNIAACAYDLRMLTACALLSLHKVAHPHNKKSYDKIEFLEIRKVATNYGIIMYPGADPGGGLRVLKHPPKLPKVNYLTVNLLSEFRYQLSNSIVQQLCLLMKLKS